MGLGSGIRDPRSGIRKKPIPDPGSGAATLMDSLKKFACVLSLSEQNNIPPTLSCGQVGSSRS
jgi:hypothetical protein